MHRSSLSVPILSVLLVLIIVQPASSNVRFRRSEDVNEEEKIPKIPTGLETSLKMFEPPRQSSSERAPTFNPEHELDFLFYFHKADMGRKEDRNYVFKWDASTLLVKYLANRQGVFISINKDGIVRGETNHKDNPNVILEVVKVARSIVLFRSQKWKWYLSIDKDGQVRTLNQPTMETLFMYDLVPEEYMVFRSLLYWRKSYYLGIRKGVPKRVDRPRPSTHFLMLDRSELWPK